ncbi:type V CRISPR-associated protein Cas12k [Nostoc sp.]|uniref:type V CRISPR-associated protein Cas12k n=1 Tax=Nostoc sp. TaxID=1180 RepID=UPI002FFB9946
MLLWFGLNCGTAFWQKHICAKKLLRHYVITLIIKISSNTSQRGKKTKKKKEDSLNTTDKTLFDGLFDAYDKTEDCLSKCAFAYLLKNNCQVNQDDEDLDKYTKRRRKKEIEIERLRNQLKSQKPKGRDLTAQKWLGTLKEATNNLPLNEDEARSWQASLLTADSYMPYPVDYETNTDLDWFTNSVDEKTKRARIRFWQAYFLSWALKSGTSSFMKYVYFNLDWFTNPVDGYTKRARIRFWQAYFLSWALKSGTSSFMKYAYFKIRRSSHGDVNWYNLKKKKGCIFVKFNGLKKKIKNPEFFVCCDSRQLDYFQRFYQDWEIWHENKETKDTYSSGLFLLRSARLVWQERKGKGNPWRVHRLILQCSIETRLWTDEGTELVRLEKINQAEQTISNMQQRGYREKTHVDRLTRDLTMRRKLENPFPGRPKEPIYQVKSNILVGVSLGLEKPATVAVVDAASKKVLTYRSVKQLLGDNYNLLNRQRQQQQRLSHERHKAQKQSAPNSFGESELGQYVDRLLADAIVAIAKTYSAGSIVIPKLGDMREIIQSEVQAKAEKKIPGYKEGQQNYAKDYRISIHRWSYGRLIESIQIQAGKSGISIESGSQPIRDSQEEQARDLALFAYQERQVKLL